MNRFLARIALRGAGLASVKPPAPIADQGLPPFDEVAIEEVRDVVTADRLTSAVSPAQARIDTPAATIRADHADTSSKANAVTQPMPATLATSILAPAAFPTPPLPAVTPSAPVLRRSPQPSPPLSRAVRAATSRSAATVEASPSATVAIPASAENQGAGARKQIKAESTELERLPIEPEPVAVLRPPPEAMPPAVRAVTQDRAPIVTTTEHGRVLPAGDDRAPRRATPSNGEPPRTGRARVETDTRSPIPGGLTPARPVEVHIGRIEVVQPAAAAPPEPASAPRAIGFDEYARARANGF